MKYSPDYIRGLYNESQKIQLIKDLRDATHFSLRESKDAVEAAYAAPNPLAAILLLFKGHLEGETVPETVPAPVDPKTTPLAMGMYHVIEHWKVLGFPTQVDAVKVIAANFN